MARRSASARRRGMAEAPTLVVTFQAGHGAAERLSAEAGHG